MFLFFILYYLMISGNFYGLETQHGIFLVLNFVGGIIWVLLEALGMPPFDDPPPALSLYIWSTLLRVKYLLKSLQPTRILWGTPIIEK